MTMALLPDFPWDSLAPYKERASSHVGGLVDLSVGTPGRPDPRGGPGGARRRRRRARLPPDLGHAGAARGRRRLVRPPSRGARARPRRGAAHDRQQGAGRPGCRPCSGSVPVTSSPSPTWPTRRTTSARASPGATPLPMRSLTALGPADHPRHAKAVVAQQPQQPDRSGPAASSTSPRSWPGPGSTVSSSPATSATPSSTGARAAAASPARCRASWTRASAGAATTACWPSTPCPSRATSPATGPRSWPVTRRWSRRLLEIRKHAGMIVPWPVQQAMVAALGDDAHVAAAAGPLRAAARGAAGGAGGARATASTTPTRASTCGPPAARTPGPRWPALADRGILVAPGSFYGAAGAQHVRVALTATDERIEAAAQRLS